MVLNYIKFIHIVIHLQNSTAPAMKASPSSMSNCLDFTDGTTGGTRLQPATTNKTGESVNVRVSLGQFWISDKKNMKSFDEAPRKGTKGLTTKAEFFSSFNGTWPTWAPSVKCKICMKLSSERAGYLGNPTLRVLGMQKK